MKHRRRQSGVALLLVLILVASATVIGVSFATSTTVKLISTDNLLKAGRAGYLAESGMEHCLYVLRTTPEALAGSDVSLLGPFAADGTSDTYYFGAADVVGQAGRYLLTGRATAGGITQTVTLTVDVQSRYKALMDSLAPDHYIRLGEPDSDDIVNDAAGDWDKGTYRNNTGHGWRGAIPHDDDPAPHFDGSDDHIELKDANDKHVDLPAGDKTTILAWVWPDSHNHLIGHNARIVSKADGLLADDHYWMVSTYKSGENTRLRFVLKTGSNSTVLVANQGNVPLNEWTLVVVTYDGARMRIYQDAALVSDCAKVGNISRDNTVKAWIGGNPSDRHHRPWHGRIDEVAVWQRALSAAEIMLLYKTRLPDVSKLSWNK